MALERFYGHRNKYDLDVLAFELGRTEGLLAYKYYSPGLYCPQSPAVSQDYRNAENIFFGFKSSIESVIIEVIPQQ